VSRGPALPRRGHPFRQTLQLDLHRVREDQQREKARLALPPLKNADLVAVDVGDFREPFLREFPPLAQAAQVLPNTFSSRARSAV
jgi:hypothetical protein